MKKYTLTNLKEYKENQYNKKLKDHLEKYIDYDELHFIESELKFFENCYHTANIKLRQYYRVINNFGETEMYWQYGYDENELEPFEENQIVENEIKDRILCKSTNNYDLVKCEQLTLTYSKILSFLNDKKQQLTTQPQQIEPQQTKSTNSLNWQGTPLQFTELIKALIQANFISPELTEKERFKRLKQFFNLDEFDEGDKLKDIRKRTNTPTPLINILETALNNWIKKKD